ncbi:hypothetical protein UFOVP371_40 [uncultured Caudovirales phage]|uniref:Uncharacterized protein n=1 Tax=uncultured Caudovirales phage TaxID=2100421 RepID=A0A6J7WXV3_9CAUD|nr:hypothetical protein UFOVP371_40 [uncultured Caudovirales phage]
MTVTIDGTSGINTPGVVNTAAETIATTLAVTGVTTVQAGTSALPAITTTGDTNTGIFFPAADTVAVSTGGSERARIDTSGNVLVTNAAGLGYGTGAGGTVTQATNKGTAVTLNKPTGQVTTNNAALASGATVSFSINNSIITATDNIMVVVTGGSSYTVQPQFVSGGVANIRLTNTTGGSLSEAVVINFAVIKGASS